MSESEQQLSATPLLRSHQSRGAKLVPFAGYSMPIQYAGLVAEHRAVRNQAGLFDVCHMGEVRITGHDALGFVQFLVTNDVDRIATGQAMYTCACRETGGIVDDLIVYKHDEQNILIVCNASNRQKFLQHLSDQAGRFSNASITDESEETGLIALQGPRALAVLGKAVPNLSDLASELPTFRFAEKELFGATTTVARTGYTGEDGVEIFCRAQDAETIWEGLLKAGESLGLVPAGLACRDTLRLEARLSLYGNELDEETNPLEAGLAWTVKFDKGDFLGKAALLAAQGAGLTKKLVGFEVTGRGSARADYSLLSEDGTPVGRCTSGSPSPTLKKAIGLGYLPPQMTEIGTKFLVDARGKHLPAQVVKTPFYRRG